MCSILRPLVLMCVAAFTLSACGRERLVGSPPSEPACQDERDCPDGEICVFNECVDIDIFVCQEGETPLIQVTPLFVELGDVAMSATGQAQVEIANVGECLLTISGVGIADTSNEGFDCSPCDLTAYPQRIAPMDALSVTVEFSPLAPGEALGAMLVRSDDLTAGVEGLVSVDLHATFSGVPVMVLDPVELAFGFVPYVAGGGGNSVTENVRIINQGTGNAELTIQFVYVRPGSDFSIPAEFGDITPSHPRTLAPYDPDDPTTWIEVPVTFGPTRNASQESALVVTALSVDTGDSVDVTAHLSGSSLGPAGILVDPVDLSFRGVGDAPLGVGTVGFGQITISNVGQSDLTLDLGLDDPSGDFSFMPSHLAALPPGAAAAVSVFYNPSAPSDPVHPSAPETSAEAYFRVISNDADHVLTTVNLHGWAASSLSDDVLKIEMSFENDASSWANNDFRNVDLELISPLGLSCRKPLNQYAPDGQGGYVVVSTRDFCQEWTDSALEGTARWLPGGIYEEPERIVLYGLGQDLAQGGVFTVRAHYVEDCANIPTGLLADLMGISVSALLGILGGQVGIPITLPPDQISGLIEQNCWSHESSLVSVVSYVNSTEVATSPTRLARKGDSIDVIKLRRENGAFVVVP